jgi:cytochrome b561
MTMAKPFPLLSRILHWTMAVLILAMLFIGIALVSSLSDYHLLVAIHKPLGGEGSFIFLLVSLRGLPIHVTKIIEFGLRQDAAL